MAKIISIIKLVSCIILFLLVSCTEKKNPQVYDKEPSLTDSIFFAESFSPHLKYDSLSLLYCGKPLLCPGQKLSELDTLFSYRPDPNGKYQNQHIITDYLSLDDNLSAPLPTNSYTEITGILFFSADRAKRQIFNVSGNWSVPFGETEKEKMEIKEVIYKQFFPVLKGKLEFNPNWTFEYKRNHYTELFTFTPKVLYKGDLWTLEYKIKMDTLK